MSGASGMGTLLLSVDLEPDLEQQAGDSLGRLDQVRRRLLELMAGCSLPATWAVADPVHSVATESIRAADPGHEIAVLGDRAWLGPGCGRSRLERELSRRFDGARQAGIPATTLALGNLDQVRDLDLLLDNGVTALRGPAAEAQAAVYKTAVPPIRYGIWQAPAGRKFPARSVSWLPASWSMRREIRRAVARQTLLHLHLGAPALAASGDHELRTVARVLHYAATRRDTGQLAIRTISQVAAEMLAERASAPSRSILRPAA